MPILWKSVSCGTEKKSGEYIAKMISAEIEALRSDTNVLAVISDNAANMRKSWNVLSESPEGEGIWFYGCGLHCLHLLTLDILKNFKNETDSAKQVIKCVKYSQFLSGKLRDLGSAHSLKLPCETRWGSYYACTDSILKNKTPLKTISALHADKFTSHPDVRNMLLSENFWRDVEMIHSVLQPLNYCIRFLESHEVTIGSLVEIFVFLKKNLTRI